MQPRNQQSKTFQYTSHLALLNPHMCTLLPPYTDRTAPCGLPSAPPQGHSGCKIWTDGGARRRTVPHTTLTHRAEVRGPFPTCYCHRPSTLRSPHRLQHKQPSTLSASHCLQCKQEEQNGTATRIFHQEADKVPPLALRLQPVVR